MKISLKCVNILVLLSTGGELQKKDLKQRHKIDINEQLYSLEKGFSSPIMAGKKHVSTKPFIFSSFVLQKHSIVEYYATSTPYETINRKFCQSTRR